MEQRNHRIFGVVLFLVTLGLYWPTTHFPFVNIDDQLYVYNNPHVIHGLNWESFKWATTAEVAANWHPFTMLSHLLDCSFFGLFAGGHHLTNILLHSLNAILLWRLFQRLTNQFWPSLVIAALFAWHPLNVESVAWVAERKNVLSTTFFMLALGAYSRFAEPAAAKRTFYYTFALLFFALGLMAKSMLVTLPFVLLLLDYWKQWPISWRTSLLEKLPFFALSLADCVITYLVQNQAGGVKSLASVPLEFRLLNAPIAYLNYLAKAFWPTKLCAFYPFPETLPVFNGIISALILLVISLVVWRFRKDFRWLMVGWFWFLGMLVPVIGLVQVGGQALADRYFYLPGIGLFLIVTNSANELFSRPPKLQKIFYLGAAFGLAILLWLSAAQIFAWQNSVNLFQKVVAVNPANATAHNLLGHAFSNAGQSTEAIEAYRRAVQIHPDVAAAQNDLGCELILAGKFSEAETALRPVILEMPKNETLHNTYGVALMLADKFTLAENEFSQAVKINPDFANAHFNWGKTLLAETNFPAATAQIQQALQLQPEWPEALEVLAQTYAASGDHQNASLAANRALKLAEANEQKVLVERLTVELKTYQKASTPQSSVP